MWATLCGALVLACSLTLLAHHRLVVDREQAWAPQWSRVQAQAMGHAGMMWALARLGDARPIDAACRSSPTGASGARFGDLVRHGARINCRVAIGLTPEEDAAGDASAWVCRCTGEPVDAPQPGGGAQAAEIVMDFTAQSMDLLLQVSVSIGPREQARGIWHEQVLLRADAQHGWKAVVGTWWDDRR